MSQAHGTTLWQEPAGSGGTPTIIPMKLIADGVDVTLSSSGTEFAILVTDGAGGAQLSTNLALTPILHLVQAKGDVILY